MNSYVTTPSNSTSNSMTTIARTGTTGYVTVDADTSNVVGGYVTDVARSAVVGSYVDCDLGASALSSMSYQLAS